jgi:hypothetical protein
MTSAIKKAKSVWHYVKYVFWGIRTNAKSEKPIVPKRAENPSPRFPNSSIADIIQTNIEFRSANADSTITSNADLLRRLKKRQAK